MILHTPDNSALIAPPAFRRLRLTLDDGSHTTAYVGSYPLASTAMRVRRLPALTRLEAWCTAEGVSEALVGGFYLRRTSVPPEPPLVGSPLGELRLAGAIQPFIPFTAPWGGLRACVNVDGQEVRIARRHELPASPAGDLLQAGPLLVRDGQPVAYHEEGFSVGADQFDSDISDGRHPRAALGCDGERLIALACDGRANGEAGLTLDELAATMAALGAREALNLDGGGSTSIVCAGRLRNTPREAYERTLPGGRAIATALVFMPYSERAVREGGSHSVPVKSVRQPNGAEADQAAGMEPGAPGPRSFLRRS
jgi:Phosphodiester glycosidase